MEYINKLFVIVELYDYLFFSIKIFPFTKIYDSQANRGRGRLFL